jgi:hypothetical protein
MSIRWGEFLTRLHALYAEYPEACEQYESEFRELQERLAEAEQAIEKAGRCLVMSNNGKAEALAILRGYKEAAVSTPASRSVQRRVALQKGEPMPEFDTAAGSAVCTHPSGFIEPDSWPDGNGWRCAECGATGSASGGQP